MCKVEWCNNKPIWKDYCRKHYDQIRKYGKITNERPRGKRNNYIIYKDYAELQILNKYGEIIVKVKVDKDDVEKLKDYSFRYDKDNYIKCAYKDRTKYLHRIVMNYDGDLEIDHINRNKLDNRKDNLRIVDRKTNANNIERKDTCYITKKNRNLTKPYCLKIKDKYIGYYKTLDEAIYIRNKYVNIDS